MLAWMIYVAVVTLVLAGAAFAAERSAQIRKAPTRWLWGASLVASLILPLVMSRVSIRIPDFPVFAERSAPSEAAPLSRVAAAPLQPSAWIGERAERATAAPDVDGWLVRGWGAASGLMLLTIAAHGLWLRRRGRAWTPTTMAGSAVFVSEDLGPAVVGLLAPRIVVPRWIAEAAPQTRALVVAHEQSHLDANDARLLVLAILLVTAMPWNLPLWWQLRRLRFAIEMDCDARVLKGGHDVAIYGETLVMVGERQSIGLGLVAAMSEPRSFLEQRIRKMLQKQKKFAWASATALAALGFVLAASAAVVAPPRSTAAQMAGADLKPYRNGQWNFSLDVPKTWNEFPPVVANSPFEAVRFASEEKGKHLLIIFRDPHDPAESAAAHSATVEAALAKGGFSHFVTGEVRIGTRVVHTLDFDRPMKDGSGRTWSCRHYFVNDGSLMYTLGFGTSDRAAMFGLFDKVAKTFVG